MEKSARARARAIRLRREAEAAAERAQATTAAVEIVDATSEPAVASVEPARRRLRVPGGARVLTVAAIVMICALLGASGYMLVHRHNAVQQRQHAAAFAAATKQGVVNMMSLDFHKAKEDVPRVIDSATGEFRDDFHHSGMT